MSKPKFLIDENLAASILTETRRYSSALDILQVGYAGAPPKGTPDPQILDYCWQEQRILITDNRTSMPEHIANRYADGEEYAGILKIRKGHKESIGGIVESIILIWDGEEAESYLNREIWIPL